MVRRDRTGSSAGGGRIKGVEMFSLARDEDGQDTSEGRHRSDVLETRERGQKLRWFGRVKRRHSGCVGGRTLKMELPGRRNRGDSWIVGIRVEDVADQEGWRRMICCGES